jgi:hypothetical protein
MKDHGHISNALITGSFFIATGLLLVLNTLGYLSWDVWGELVKFWPIFIILAGIEVMAGKALVPNLLLGIVGVMIIAGVSVYGAWKVAGHELNTPSQILENLHITLNPEDQITGNYQVEAEDYPETSKVDLDVTIGSQTFIITDTSNEDNLLTLSSKHYSNFGEPEISASSENGVLSLAVKPKEQSFVLGLFGEVSYSLNMGKNDIPTDLEITIGSGNGSLTLTNQILDDLNINVGSGNISIDVSNVSLPKELALEVGSGDVSLSIPSDVGIEMDYTIGSGEIRFGEDLVFD